MLVRRKRALVKVLLLLEVRRRLQLRTRLLLSTRLLLLLHQDVWQNLGTASHCCLRRLA